MKNILFLAGNSVTPLQASIIQLLSETGRFEVELLYQKRQGTNHTWPMPGRLDQKQLSEICWPSGSNIISKFVNKAIVVFLFARQIKKKKPHIIHACSPIETLIAARCCRKNGYQPKIVYVLQDTYDWMQSWIGRMLQRWAFHKLHAIFVTSDAFEDRFLRKFDLIENQTNVVYVPNVPRTNVLRPPSGQFNKDCMTIGWFGTLRGIEGLQTLVEGVRHARRNRANVKILFAGTGINIDTVEEYTRLYSFIDYTGPYQYDDDIQNLYNRVDVVYALYDRSYDKKIHIPCRLSESINCGLPIIVGKDTHMADIVEREGIGVSAPIGDSVTLGNVILELYNNPLKRHEIFKRCQALRYQYVFEFYHDKILEVYEP